MASGDTVFVRVYLAVDGINQRRVDSLTLSGVQDDPVLRVLTHVVPYNSKFRCTITQTSGTLRSFPYAFVLQVLEVY